MSRPRLLDLFCGSQGAGMGYHRAGFDVTGVDIAPQPHAPLRFVQFDALEYLAEHGHEFDAVHASPPCRDHTELTSCGIGVDGTGWLLDATRQALTNLGKPWVIENVMGADLIDPVVLCGCMFALGADGYRLERKRKFESNVDLPQMDCACRWDPRPVVGVYGGKVRNRRQTASVARTRVGSTLPLSTGQKAMGIDWMSRAELSLAVPPVYTEWIGLHLLKHVRKNAA